MCATSSPANAGNQAKIDAYNAATVQRMEPGIQAYWALRSTRRRLKRLKPSPACPMPKRDRARRVRSRARIHTGGAARLSSDSDGSDGGSDGSGGSEDGPPFHTSYPSPAACVPSGAAGSEQVLAELGRERFLARRLDAPPAILNGVVRRTLLGHKTTFYPFNNRFELLDYEPETESYKLKHCYCYEKPNGAERYAETELWFSGRGIAALARQYPIGRGNAPPSVPSLDDLASSEQRVKN